MNTEKIKLLKQKIDVLNNKEIKELFYELYDDLMELDKKVMIDDLTQIYNRRILDDDIEYQILAICDVDNFKSINDKLGHSKGDKILVDVTKTFKKILGKKGTICRYGGDEFIILFNGINLDTSLELMNILKNEIKFEIDDMPVTISYGIAERTGNKNITEVIQEADKALYKSKEEGKNKITVYKKNIDMNPVSWTK